MRKLTLILLISVLTLFSTACTQNNIEKKHIDDFYTNSNHILINGENSSYLAFEVALFSKKKVKDIKYIGLEGNNVDNLNVEIIDNTIDDIKNHIYKKLYTTILMVSIENTEQNNKDVQINNLKLNIDGELRTIKFKTPIKHSFTGGNIFDEYFEPSVIPNEMSASLINNDSIVYEFNTRDNIKLEKIYCSDFVEPIIAEIYIDDSVNKNIKQLPINLSSNKNIKLALNYKNNNNDNEFKYIGTNIYFEYSIDGSENKKQISSSILFNPIYPMYDNDLSNIDNYIEKIISD